LLLLLLLPALLGEEVIDLLSVLVLIVRKLVNDSLYVVLRDLYAK
jgi:hypothetical protein